MAIIGTPGGIRTHDPGIRNPVLYPTELQAHIIFIVDKCLLTENSLAFFFTTVVKIVTILKGTQGLAHLPASKVDIKCNQIYTRHDQPLILLTFLSVRVKRSLIGTANYPGNLAAFL